MSWRPSSIPKYPRDLRWGSWKASEGGGRKTFSRPSLHSLAFLVNKMPKVLMWVLSSSTSLALAHPFPMQCLEYSVSLPSSLRVRDKVWWGLAPTISPGRSWLVYHRCTHGLMLIAFCWAQAWGYKGSRDFIFIIGQQEIVHKAINICMTSWTCASSSLLIYDDGLVIHRSSGFTFLFLFLFFAVAVTKLMVQSLEGAFYQ